MTRTSLRIALFATLVAVLALVPSALAGKGRPGGGGGGGRGGSGTIALTLLNSTDGLAHFGQKVTFAVSATTTTQPWVALECSQNGTVVYKQANGIFANSLNQVFTLGPTPVLDWRCRRLQGLAAGLERLLEGQDHDARVAELLRLRVSANNTGFINRGRSTDRPLRFSNRSLRRGIGATRATCRLSRRDRAAVGVTFGAVRKGEPRMYRNTTRLASLFGTLALVMSAVALAGPEASTPRSPRSVSRRRARLLSPPPRAKAPVTETRSPSTSPPTPPRSPSSI